MTPIEKQCCRECRYIFNLNSTIAKPTEGCRNIYCPCHSPKPEEKEGMEFSGATFEQDSLSSPSNDKLNPELVTDWKVLFGRKCDEFGLKDPRQAVEIASGAEKEKEILRKAQFHYADRVGAFQKARWTYFIVFPFWYPLRHFDFRRFGDGDFAFLLRMRNHAMFHVWIQRRIERRRRKETTP